MSDKDKKWNIKRIAVMSMLLTIAIILGYVEAILPIDIGVPGIKLGLPNLISVFILYYYGFSEGFIVGFLRVLIIGFLFTSPALLIYSLSGFVISYIVMGLLKRINIFSVYAVSMGAAVIHNLTQLLLAIIITHLNGFIFYGGVLMLAGLFTGWLNGLLSGTLLKIFNKSGIKENY